MPASGALKSAAMAAAAPQPTMVRSEARLSFSRRPIELATAPPNWVTPASSPTEAPSPTAPTVSPETIRLSFSDMMPPWSALASITSRASCLRQRRRRWAMMP